MNRREFLEGMISLGFTPAIISGGEEYPVGAASEINPDYFILDCKRLDGALEIDYASRSMNPTVKLCIYADDGIAGGLWEYIMARRGNYFYKIRLKNLPLMVPDLEALFHQMSIYREPNDWFSITGKQSIIDLRQRLEIELQIVKEWHE